MSAKQGNGSNKLNIRKITVYALMVSLCLIVGYLESLLSGVFFTFAPGIKLGLSNALVLTLVCNGDKKGAFLVNIARILLSASLFGSAISFAFALSGGLLSLCTVCVLCRLKSVSAIGVSIVGGVVHNMTQCIVCVAVTGVGMFYYLPLLIAGGAVCGAFCGIFSQLILKKVKTNGII